MKTVIDKAASRGYADHGWLQTNHTFSFADYRNPNRVHFGKLRVLNDDTVAPGKGFGTHPHQNMEVISIPLKGYLRHGDSINNMSVITPGDIQLMSTGSGIYHSELNGSDSEPVEFLQIWVFPKENDTPPIYKNIDIRATQKRNELSFIIAPDGTAPATILQDSWFSLGTLDADQQKEYRLHGKDMGVYLFVIEGEVSVAGNVLEKRDGAGFWEADAIDIKIMKDSTLLLIEVPMF